ncbi:MAG: PD-(D/E)XK nuclease family protein [Spirochaetaceae bacterium]|nr:PD-(D/E)XK nuclease family protein [Spirochaetaceae bacterium]
MAAKEDFRPIEDVICEFLNEDNVRFIFPSSVAMETWSDWAVKNSARTGCKAVALEKWLVWDAFKNEFAQIRDSSKNCIPETLRKLFVRSLLHENSSLVKSGSPSFLHPLISREFAKNSLYFTSWLSAILPSLDLWNTKFTEKHADNIEAALAEDDGENKVYAFLYRRYAEFLEKAGMFDPAWVKLNDIDQTYHFVIFHPEQLKDFNDYKEKIEKANATLVRLPPEQENGEHPQCVLYPNARMELRRTVLRIRELHEKQNVCWSDIALTVPNLETYRPYIERELNNYCVPFAMRSGLSYTQNCAGRVFEEIQNCFDSGFNLESVRTVLQDSFIPWQKPEINEAIVQTAIETRSICPYKQNGKIIDPIEEALAAKTAAIAQLIEESAASTDDPEAPESAETATEKLELAQAALDRYTSLKKCFSSICGAKSFKAVKEAWQSFESGFLYEAKIWPNDKDNIVGICIAELTKYIAIEKEHSEKLGLKIEKPYEFFLDELSTNIYTPQKPKNICISVFDYRAAADAYFDYHFVINANQKDLEVPFKELGFLSEKKRAELGADDNEGATEAYIRLYAKTGRDRVFFSSSTNSFDGFAIPHTYFDEIDILKSGDPTAYLDKEDFFLNEKKYLLETEGGAAAAAPDKITELQRGSFLAWQAKKSQTQIDMNKVNSLLSAKAKASLVYDENFGKGKFKISQTDLKNFFPCRRKWIFNKVVHLKEESPSVELMSHFDFGNICHKIVELVFEEYAKTGRTLPVLDSDSDIEELRTKVEAATEKALTEKDKWTRADDFKNSRLAVDMLLTQKHIFSDYIMNFMRQFCCLPKKESGTFAGYSVNGVEKSFSAKLNQSYELYGRIDCILAGNDEQGNVIIDYKTGSLPKRDECYPDNQNALNNFQMAFYYKLLSEQSKRYDVQDGLFYSLKKDSKNKFDKTYIISSADNSGKEGTKKIYSAEEFEEKAGNLLDLYLNDFTGTIDSAGFEPPSKNKNGRTTVKTYLHCANCDYNNICRTTFAVAKEEL